MTITTSLGSGLRVLAYHAVGNAELFDEQISYLAQAFNPIRAEEAARGLKRRSQRPPVWVTLDDGDPSLVDVALDVLTRHGIEATAFVCPAVIGTSEPFWWEVVEAAAAESIEIEGLRVDPTTVAWLKTVADRDRRYFVRAARESVETRTGFSLVRPQITRPQLRRWVDAGHAIGNHTWDHPLLDMCDDQEQLHQVNAAHEWLVDELRSDVKLFAYPNGNSTATTERRLQSLGYQVAALFDHRVHKGSNPLQMSRIRVNATDPLEEFKARVSGIHPAVHRTLNRQ